MPRYILDLLLSIIGLSMKTLQLVDALPKLVFEEKGNCSLETKMEEVFDNHVK